MSEYFNAFIQSSALKNIQSINANAYNNPGFTYGSVTYSQFSQFYNPKGWLLRKVTALPQAAWSGIIKTTCHLALAILIGIPSLMLQRRTFKSNLYCAIRDVQESYGHIVSIFNDRFGSYQIQESQFHKKCYNAFSTPHQNTVPNSNVTPRIPNPKNPGGPTVIPPLPAVNDSNLLNPNLVIDYQVPPPPPVEGEVVYPSFHELQSMLNLLYSAAHQYNNTERQLNLKGINTRAHYNGIELRAFIANAQATLSHPLVPQPTIANLTAWKSLLDKMMEAERGLYKSVNYQILSYRDELKPLYDASSWIAPIQNCVAKGYYDLGDKDFSFAVIKETSAANDFKEKFIKKLASDFYSQGNINQTLVVIKELYQDQNTKEAYYKKIAYNFYLAGNVVNAIEINKLINNDQATKDKFLCKIAFDYLQNGNLEESLKVIKSYHDYKTKEIFFLKIAGAYSLKGDLVNSLRTIKEIYHDHAIKEKFILDRLVYASCSRGDLENSLKLTKEVVHDYKSKEKWVETIANGYFLNGDLEKSLKIIKEIYHDHQAKEKFILEKLVHTYYARGDLENGFKVCKEVNFDRPSKEKWFETIAKAYLRNGNRDKAKEVANHIYDTNMSDNLLRLIRTR